MIADADLLSIQQARILAENAREGQRRLAAFSQEKLDAIVEAVAEAVAPRCRDLARLSAAESGCGRPGDKERKNLFACRTVPAALRGMRCVGVLDESGREGLVEVGVPVGVIAAFCPLTSPVSTCVYTTLIALKSGNSVIFAPHPGAAGCMAAVLEIMLEAARAKGLPEGCLSYLSASVLAGARELMEHPAVSLLLLTGVPGLYPVASRSGKPVIYGGAGYGPAYIERSADVERAVADIVRSKTFDNGIAPAAEQSVVVDAPVAATVRRALAGAGARFLSEAESRALAEMFFDRDGRVRRRMIGRDAPALAAQAGFTVPGDTSLLISERGHVSADDPWSRGFPAPVLALYEEPGWEHACETCLELLLHERNAHSLTIHSRDEAVIRQFALKKPVGRLLVNTPAAFGGIGASSRLFPALTLGGGSAGFGVTSDNVSPAHLIYRRQVAYGTGGPAPDAVAPASDASCGADARQGLAVLRRLLREALAGTEQGGM